MSAGEEDQMRLVVVGSVLAVTGSLSSCRNPPPQAPSGSAEEAPSAVGSGPATASVVTVSHDAGTASPGAQTASIDKRPSGNTIFVKSLGSLHDPKIAGDRSAVVVAASGGCSDDQGSLAAGPRESGSFVLLAKLDGEGNRLWTKSFSSPCDPSQGEGEGPEIAGVGVDRNGNVYVAGDLTSGSGSFDFGGGVLAAAGGHDVFVASFDGTGQHRWSKRFGNGADQRVRGVAVSPEGLVALTGSLEGSADFGGGVFKSAGKSDAFVAVFDGAGQHLASHAFGDPGDQHGELISFGGQGELTLAGSYEGAIDFGGGPLPVGKTTRKFVALYSDNGPGASPRYSFSFSKALPPDVTIGALAAGSDGVYVAGAFRGVADFGGGSLKAHEPDDKNAATSDAYVVKLDPAGKYVFGKSFGLGGTHRIEGLALAGDLWMAGEFSGMTRFVEPMMSAGSTDALLARIDPEKGDAKAAWRFGDTFAQGIGGLVSAGAPSSLYLLARSSGTIDFGTGPRSEHGAFIAGMALEAAHPVAPRAPDAPKPAPGR
jgi:hypothetical protein